MPELIQLYDGYVDTFRDAEGRLPKMMELKRLHTALVVKNAEAIAEGEKFSAEERSLAIAAALLHDTGRYEQLKRYNTFKDSDSVDHAVFSHDIVKGKGWLDLVLAKYDSRLGVEELKDIILKAILYHNRRDLPKELEFSPADLDARLRLLYIVSHTVRDADKLDIFRVLEDQLSHTDWKKDTRAFWNLSISAAPNPLVIKCIENAEPVDYQNIQSLADFVLIQVGWMVSGLHFRTARELCRARGHLDFRRKFLHELTDDPSIDRLCDLAAQHLV